ncbi:MAG TPA: DUF4476 domain-containing protein [Kofleriaceae bacterium]
MTRIHVFSIAAVLLVLLAARHAAADDAADRTAVAEAFAKLSSYADGIARDAAKSDDRVARRKLASLATDIAEDLGRLAQRARKDVPYAALAKDTAAIGKDAATLVETADEVADKTERKTLRAQAAALEQGIAATRKVLDTMRDADAKPQPMRDAAFQQFVQTVKQASFDEDKVAIVRHVAQSNWFRANQVAAVMDLLSFDDGKIDAAAAMWPRMTDPENSFVIFNKLAFDSSKEKLRKRVAK